MTTRTAGWIYQQFEQKEGVVRRNKKSVQKYSTRQELLKLVKSQNGHLIETNTDFIAVYGTEYLKIWC